jgi:hypothetical protein
MYRKTFEKIKLIKTSFRNFHLLTPEEYFVNMKESLRKTQVDSAKLLPLKEAST